jgi:hypothetical protein
LGSEFDDSTIGQNAGAYLIAAIGQVERRIQQCIKPSMAAEVRMGQLTADLMRLHKFFLSVGLSGAPAIEGFEAAVPTASRS